MRKETVADKRENGHSTKITVIGSTGLIGKTFLESIADQSYAQVTAITRREIPALLDKNHIRQSIQNFSNPDELRSDLKSDVLVCALGTTIKTAGSKERFKAIDHDLPLKIAEMSVEEGCQMLILISAIGADAKSNIFYNKSKGQLEDDIQHLKFKTIHILRPSMLYHIQFQFSHNEKTFF